MKIKIGVIMLAIAALMMLSVGLISAGAHNTISGTVIDGTDRTPIEGAEVVVDGTDPVLSATTDEDGNYEIVGVPKGEQSFTASADDYDSEQVGATIPVGTGDTVVNFSLQPVDGDEDEDADEPDDADGDVRAAGTRRGYVGIYSVPATSSATEAAFSADSFIVKTKKGDVEIQIPGAGLISITETPEITIKTPGRPNGSLADGDRIVVLVEFEDQGGEDLVKVAIQIIVKPSKPLPHVTGAVVSVTTDENGVRTVSIMRGNGKVKEMQLGPNAEVPEVGDVVTAFQGRGRGSNGAGANGAPFVTGMVRADAVRERLEGFLDDLTSGAGEPSPEAAEGQARRVTDIAALLEAHAAKHVAIIRAVIDDQELPDKAFAGMMKGLEKTQNGLDQAMAKSTEAKTKADGLRPAGGGNQGGRGNSGR